MMTNMVRATRLALLVSTGLIALAPVAGRAETGVAFQGSVTLPAGVTLSGSGDTDTIAITAPSTVLDWSATGPVVAGNVVDFLPQGKSGVFVGAAGLSDYVVLNRVLPAGGAADPAAIAFNGTVVSRITPAGGGGPLPGGTIWFYSPGGIIAGPTARFDIGSLLLTANAVETSGGIDRNRIVTRATGLADKAVTIADGARITASRAGSYVALVAPRVTQAGVVSVNGSAAYVASGAATLSINRGLFDIELDGAGGAGGGAGPRLVHGGVTEGPAAAAGSGEASRVYMVTLPANDAVTMLVGGRIGFAQSASTEQGVVVLAAGTGVVDQAAATLDADAGSAVAIGGARFTSRVAASVIGTIDVRSTGAGDAVSFTEGATLLGTRGVTLDASGDGAAITAGGAIALRTRDGGGSSVARIGAANGGTVALSRALTVDTTPEGAGARGRRAGPIAITGDGGRLVFGDAILTAKGDGFGTGRGGAVSFDLRNGAAADVNELTVDVGGVGGGRPLVAGQGGDVSIVTQAGTRLAITAGLTVAASGAGGSNGEPVASQGIGGTVSIASAGVLSVGQSIFIRANGSGGAGGVVAGSFPVPGSDGQGGRVTVDIAGPATLRNLEVEAAGFGAAGGRTDGTGGAGGAGTGGEIAVRARDGLTARDILLRASAQGGAGTLSGDGRSGGAGGAARSGSASLRLDGAATIGAVGMATDAAGGAGAVAGDSGRGGAAAAGAATFVAGGSSIRLSDSLSISASATGGASDEGLAGGVATGGLASVETFGDATVQSIGLSADAAGHVDGGGAITGGTASLTTHGALSASVTVRLSARAALAGGAVNNGTVQGGAVSVRAADGGSLASRENLLLDASADGRGASPGDRTVNAAGGSVLLSTAGAGAADGAAGGRIDARQAVSLTAEAIGGEANDGGDATGGAIAIDVTRGGSLSIVEGLTASTRATAGRNYDSRDGTAIGGGVTLTGAEGSSVAVAGITAITTSALGYAGGADSRVNRAGDAAIRITGGGDPTRTRLSLNALRITATGIGDATGGGFGGNGVGGAITIDLRQATTSIASLAAEARGLANAGLFGGNGAGGAIRLTATGGTLALPGALSFDAVGTGTGSEDLYGTGRGGSAIVEASGDARLDLGALTLTASGEHSDGQGPTVAGTAEVAATRGIIALDSASLYVAGITGALGPALNAEATPVGDVRLVERDRGTDRYAVGAGPAELRLDVADGGGGAYTLMEPGSSLRYAGPGGGRFALFNRVRFADPSRRANLSGFITAETPGDISFYNPGGIALTRSAVVRGGRLTLTTDGGAGVALQGTPTVIAGGVAFDRTTTLDTITLSSRNALIDWSPRDTGPAGTIDFLPQGRTALFRGGADFTVLNRVLPLAGGRAVAFNGTVLGRVTADGVADAPGGNVWFYSPGGIVAGASARFDVGSLLLSANAVQFEGDFADFQADRAFRLVADADGAAGVIVAAGAQLSATASNGSVTLAAPRVEQAGEVSADRFVAYVATRHLSLDTGAAQATILAPAGAGGGLVHTGRTDITGDAAARRILLAGARTGEGASVLADGRIGLASAAGLDVAVAAGRNLFGIAITVPGNDARYTAETGGARVTVSATGLAAVGADGPGRFDVADLAVSGARARVAIGGGATFTTTGNLTLTASDSATLTVAGDAVVGGATRLVAAAAAGGAGVAGGAVLDVSGTLDTGTLALDASAGGAAATGGLASAVIGGGLRVRGDARIGADATATSGDGNGGRAQFVATNGAVRIDGDLVLDAAARSSGSGRARAGDVRLDAGDAPFDVGGRLALIADARLDDAVGGTAGAITLSARQRVAAAGLSLSALGDAGSGTIGVAAGSPGMAIGGALDAATSGDLLFATDGTIAARAVTLTAAGAIGLGGGLALSADRIAIRAGGTLEARGRSLAANTIELRANAIVAGDLSGRADVLAVADRGDLAVANVRGGTVRLDAAGALTLGGATMVSGDLTASGPITAGGPLVAEGALSIASGGALRLADVRAAGLALRGAGITAGALDGSGADVDVVSRAGLAVGAVDGASVSLAAADAITGGAIRADGAVRVDGRDLAIGPMRGGVVTLVARGGGLSVGAVTGATLSLTSAGDLAAGALEAGGAVTLASGGGVRLDGAATAGDAISIVARGAVTAGDIAARTLSIESLELTAGALAARGGDLSVRGGGGPVTTGALSATGALTVTGGVLSLGPAAAGGVLALTGDDVAAGALSATAMTVEARTGDAAVAGARGGGLRVIAARDLALGASEVGGGVTLTAGRDATLAILRAGDVTLAAGGVATLADVSGGGLSLRAARLTAGVLDARDGIEATASAGRLTIARAVAQRGIMLSATDGAALGVVEAGLDIGVRGAIVGSGDLTITAGGAIATDAIERTGAVRLVAGAGLTTAAIRASEVALRGARVTALALAATDGGIAASATGDGLAITSAAARDDVTLTAATALTSGAVSGRDLMLAGGSVALGALTGTGGVEIVSTRAIALDTVTAGGAARLAARDAIDFAALDAKGDARIEGSLVGARDLTVRAGGALTVTGGVERTGRALLAAERALSLGDARATDLALRGGTVSGGALRGGTIDARATAGTLTLAAVEGGAVTLGASGGIDAPVIRGTDVGIVGDLIGRGAFLIDASGAADVAGTIRRAGALSLTAPRLTLRDATAEAMLLRGDAIVAGALTATAGDIDVRAGALDLASATASGDVRLAATRGVSIGAASAGGRLAIDGDLVGAGDLSLSSGGGLAFAGDIDRAGAVTLESGGDLVLRAVVGRAVRLRGATVSADRVTAGDGALLAESAGALGLGAVEAGGDVSLAAGGALRFASLRAGGGARLRGGRIEGGTVRAAAAIDAAATVDGLAIGVVDGAGVTLTAATDLTAAALTSRVDATLDAGGDVTVSGATVAEGALGASTGKALTLRDITAGAAVLRGARVTAGAIATRRGGLDATATAGGVDLGTIAAAGGLVLTAAGGPVALGDATAAGARLRGARVTGGALTAGDGIDVVASGGDIRFGALTTRGLLRLEAAGALAAGDLTAGAAALTAVGIAAQRVEVAGNLVATSSEALALGPIDTKGALTLTGGAITLGETRAATARVRGQSIAGATLAAAGAVDAEATAGRIDLAAVSVGGGLRLAATGDLIVGRLDAAGTLSASGAGVTIARGAAAGGTFVAARGVADIGTLSDAAGGITLGAGSATIAGLDAVGAVAVTTTDSLTVTQASSRAGIALTSLEGDVTAMALGTAVQSGAAATPAVATRPGDIAVSAGRNARLGSIAARGLLRVDAGGAARFDGEALGAAIEVASTDVAIAPGGGLGAGPATTSVRLVVKPGTRALVGAGAGGDGLYVLDDGEVGRVRARQIVLAAGRADGDAGRAADVTVGALTLRRDAGGGDASLFGDAALFHIETPGIVRVTGQVTGRDFRRADRVELVGGERLDIVAPGGGITLGGAGASPGGQLLLASDRVVVATGAAARDVAALPTARERGDRLGLTDGAVAPGGYVSADRLEFRVGRALYIQNSGGTALEARAGFTTGQGGLAITGAGSAQPEVIINGRGVDDGGVVIRAGAAFQPQLGSTAAGSSINGCSDGGGLCAPTIAMLETVMPAVRATNVSALQVVQGREAVNTGMGVSSAISSLSGAADAEADDGEADEGGGEGKSAARANARILITTRGIANTSLMPLVDEPVTSVGNDDFWLDTVPESAFHP